MKKAISNQHSVNRLVWRRPPRLSNRAELDNNVVMLIAEPALCLILQAEEKKGQTRKGIVCMCCHDVHTSRNVVLVLLLPLGLVLPLAGAGAARGARRTSQLEIGVGAGAVLLGLGGARAADAAGAWGSWSCEMVCD